MHTKELWITSRIGLAELAAEDHFLPKRSITNPEDAFA